MPLYPEIHVGLSNVDGNALYIIGNCRRAAKKAGLSKEKIDEFTTEAQSGDYDNVLATAFKWFEID